MPNFNPGGATGDIASTSSRVGRDPGFGRARDNFRDDGNVSRQNFGSLAGIFSAPTGSNPGFLRALPAAGTGLAISGLLQSILGPPTGPGRGFAQESNIADRASQNDRSRLTQTQSDAQRRQLAEQLLQELSVTQQPPMQMSGGNQSSMSLTGDTFSFTGARPKQPAPASGVDPKTQELVQLLMQVMG